MSRDLITEKFEWTAAKVEGEESESQGLSPGLSGTARFIIGGVFSREVRLNSLNDCRYFSELLALAYQTGYTQGKDKILNQLTQILDSRDL